MYEIGKIPGPSLLGFEGSFVGAPPPVKRPLVGKPKPTPQKQGSAGGSSIKAGTKTKYGPAVAVKPSQNVKQHGKTLSAARTTAAKAVKSALNAMNAAKAKPKKPAISPAKRALIGAALQQPQKLTPKQQQALAKQKAAATKAGQLAKAAALAGQKAKKTAIELAKKATDQKATAVRLRKKGATKIKGYAELGAALEEYYTQIGAVPDPLNPGYLDDGSPDPAYFGDASMAADDMSMPALDSGFEVPMDTAAELPPPPDINTVYPNYETIGGIPYNGEKGYPIGYVGSLNYFTEKAQGKTGAFTDWYGYIFGGDPNRPSWPGDDPTKWVHVHGHHTGKDWWNNTDINDALTSIAKTAPNGVPYGPLVGNPAMPDFAGMRVDGQGRGYWLPQEAPDWITFPLKQAAALTAKAEKEAAEAAAKADAAAMAKIQADNALAQAQQDAANALAESQAASEQAIAQAQQETQMQQLDIDQVKADQAAMVMQQQADMQAMQQEQQLAMMQAQQEMQQEQLAAPLLAQQAQMELQQQQAAQEMLLDQARREQQYLAQHPEVEFAPQGGGEEQAEEGPPPTEQYAEDDGGGGAGYDDDWSQMFG